MATFKSRNKLVNISTDFGLQLKLMEGMYLKIPKHIFIPIEVREKRKVDVKCTFRV